MSDHPSDTCRCGDHGAIFLSKLNKMGEKPVLLAGLEGRESVSS